VNPEAPTTAVERWLTSADGEANRAMLVADPSAKSVSHQ